MRALPVADGGVNVAEHVRNQGLHAMNTLGQNVRGPCGKAAAACLH